METYHYWKEFTPSKTIYLATVVSMGWSILLLSPNKTLLFFSGGRTYEENKTSISSF